MSLNVTVFEAVAPEFAGLSDTSQRDTLATLAENQVSSDIWGNHYDHAVALLTAHMMKLSSTTSSGNQVKMEKVGDVQRTYSVNENETDEMRATKYGREFLRIRKQILKTPFVVC